MKSLLLLISSIFLTGLQAQILFTEDFENGLPTDWTIETRSTDGGWNVGSSASLSSNAYSIPANGSFNIIATNDDNCDCDKSKDLLITPLIDPGANAHLFLKLDYFFLERVYQGDQELGQIEISRDKENWEIIDHLHGNHGEWEKLNISLDKWLDEGPFYLGFRYHDAGQPMFGLALDNVSVIVPPVVELELYDLNATPFGETNCPIPISAKVWNKGSETIENISVTLDVDGVANTQDFTDLDFQSLDVITLDLAQVWLPERSGFFNIEVSVNTTGDEDQNNNSIAFTAEIFDKLDSPDHILEIFERPKVEEHTGASTYLNRPTDLDFFPINGKDELWIVNQRNEANGGSTLKIGNATQGPQTHTLQVDGNAWHFMSLPTGIAFSDDNFNFATSPGVRDANHSGGTFTGPTLWSSDPAIYAQPSGGNGSHLDMLHGSPFSMGIAHEKDNVFWVYDDFNDEIVRYDFVEDHGPGAADHSDGQVFRYGDIGIGRILDLPNHMILDKETGWLYFTDNGKSRVMRLDINSGRDTIRMGNLNEPLAAHNGIYGFTTEVIIDSDILFPTGIEIYNGKLLVGDWASGDLVAYDMNDNFTELGRITTVQGLCGIKVGPDGNIWTVNRELNTLDVISIGDDVANNNLTDELQVQVYPNPVVNELILDVKSTDTYQVRITDARGQAIVSEKTRGLFRLNTSDYENGMYLIQVRGEDIYYVEKVMFLD